MNQQKTKYYLATFQWKYSYGTTQESNCILKDEEPVDRLIALIEAEEQGDKALQAEQINLLYSTEISEAQYNRLLKNTVDNSEKEKDGKQGDEVDK